MQKILFILISSLLFSYCQEKKSKMLYDENQTPSVQKKEEEVAAKVPGGTNVGDVAPEISLLNPEGKMISLSSLRGKYVLIDFWASWCGPCRGENPNVVKMYNKYKDKNFEIYGVSLDANKEQWISAIADDHLSWIHVSELKAWDSAIVPLYQIGGIPATFLLDKKGKIIAKDLRGEELEKKLREVLK